MAFQNLDQIAYVPSHIERIHNYLDHPDVEFGFILDQEVARKPNCFCRYWFKGKLGTLRTLANGESTNKEDLVAIEKVDGSVIAKALVKIYEQRR